MNSIRDQLLTSLSLSGAGYYPREKLLDIACSHPGCEDRELVEQTLNELVNQGLVAQNEGLVYAVPTELDLANYFSAADKYRRGMAKNKKLTTRFSAWFMRLVCKMWARCWGSIILLVATAFLTLGLYL